MPIYKLNGKTYNIPDNVASNFEKDNPNATVNYQANGKTYGIPLSKRDGFLKKYPDAVLEGQQPKQPAPQPTQTQVEQPTVTAQEPTPQPQKNQSGPYKPTEQELMGFGMTMNAAQNTAKNVTKGIDEQEKNRKNASPVGDGQTGLVFNKNLRKGQKSFNAETGQFEDTYMTTDGKSYTNPGEASNMQDFMDYQGEMAQFKENMEKLGIGDITGESEKDINERIKNAYAELEALDVERDKGRLGQAARLARGMGIAGGSGLASGDMDNAQQQDYILSARRMLERRIKALEAERDNAGFWQGTADVLTDDSSLSFGLSDAADMKLLDSISKKIDAANGGVPNLTNNEKLFVRNYLMNQEAQTLNNNRGWLYTTGQGFGQTLDFMKDFAVTGGGFANVAKAGYRLGTKGGLKIAESGMAKYLTKNLGLAGKALTKTMQYGTKFGGLAAGAEIGGAMQANTVGVAKTFSDIANRSIGTLSVDKEGKLSMRDSEDLGKAILYGELKNSGENASELVGPAFDIIPGMLGRVIRNKVGGELLKKITSNKFWRGGEKALDFMGIQSVFGEGMEEEYGMLRTSILNSITGGEFDPNAESITDLDTQLNTWATVGLTGALLRAPQMVASGYGQAHYYGYKYNLNQSDNRLKETLADTDRYNTIKSMLDGSTNANIGNAINQLVRQGQLSDQEKEAVMLYAQDLINLRGYNIGTVLSASRVADITPRVASYRVSGNSFDELDENGNVIAHHDYENRDDMKAGLYEAQQTRFDNDLNADISVMKSRPNGGFDYDKMLADYSVEVGVEPSVMEEALSKPSMERTDVEQQLVTGFAKAVHDTVYDNTMLHEEQSAQDGQKEADNASIDIENPNPEAGSEIKAKWIEAQDKRRIAFESNEELKQEVTRMEGEGLSHQEILSRLETFLPIEQQAMIDYYNQKAQYEAFVNQMGNKIDEEAADSTQRHTMKGTINGNADLGNIYTISDGTNEYYLVSGNITTDPATGRITGSNSGLIIGMDLDGSFVQLNETDGYSLMPNVITAAQFEEAERTRLQEAWSPIIATNQPLQEQPSEGQASAEAGANSVTGANEAQPAPSVEAAQEEAAQPQQPAVNIESVTGKDGIKRYENGIAVDDAIADIQNDGFDVNEIADASIAEAQQAIDKINNKASKTRKDLMDKKNAQATIDYYNNVKARWVEMNPPAEPAESEEIVNVQPEEPIVKEKPVSSQSNLTVEEQKQQRIAEAKAKYGELFDDDFTKAEDASELASMWVGRKRNLAWEDVNGKRGLQKELGWTRKIGGDTKYIETLLAKNGEGIGIDEFVHMVWQSEENMGADGNPRFTTEEIKEALLDLIKSAQSKSDVVDYALNTRIAKAEAALQEQRQRAEEDAQNLTEEVAPITDEEQARIEASLPFARPEDGVDIPENPINALWAVIREVSQDGGMPAVRMVDTDLMTEGDWIDFASEVFDGAFVSEEDVNTVRSNAFEMGIVYNDATDTLIVFSGAVTPESLRENLEQFKQAYNETEELSDTDNEGLRDEMQDGESAETPAAEGANESEGQRSPESVEDPYLQPRNAEEEQIVTNVLAQLQQEIGDAVEDANNARTELEKARAKESERATDLFANDETFAEPDAIFSQEEMGLDTSSEGVERRTAAQREKLQEATNKLNRLQSIEERNSRIRGALDNYRRQTKIETEEQPKTQSREDYLASHPLTEEQIMADTEANEDEKLNAIDFLNGEDSVISRFYYDQIYERAQNSSSEKRQKKEESKPAKEKNKEEKPQQPQDKWQYQFHYDKETGRAWITRDDVSGPIPLQDGRFYIEGKSLAELRGILENPANNLGELLKEVEAQLHNAEIGEEIRKSTTPTEAIETAAQAFREEQKSKDQQDIDDALKEFNDFLDNAKGSNVLDKFMRKGLEGNDKAQASLLDAFTLTNEAQRMFLKDLLRLASKVGYAYIKSGVHDVQAWSKKMSDSIGAKLREVLGWDDAIIGEFVDEVWNQKYTIDGQRMRLSEHAERLKNTKSADQTVNDNKKEDNEPEKDLSLQQKPASELEGDSAEFADRQYKIEQLSKKIRAKLQGIMNWGDQPKPLSVYKQIAKELGIENLSDTDLQELIETEVVSLAREIANKEGLTEEKKFQKIVKLYEGQPSLNARDNDRINKQQYSTPAPMAYLMGRFLSNGKKVESGLEPSAGNGMLTINLPKEKMHVNDIDEMRLSNLQKQGFGEVTSQDGLQSFGDRKFDVVVTNPPFGNVTPKVYDGIYEISGLEHQMAINALESMKDDGRAAIIIGGNTEYNQNGSIKGKDRTFLNYLYAHYNVVDVINMNGHELYSRQGTGFPVRMILINGRKEFNPRSFAPTIQKARAERVNSYDELFKRVNDDILSDSNKPAGVHDTESGKSGRVDDTSNAGASTETGVRNVRTGGSQKQPAGRTSNGSSVSGSSNTTGGTDTKGKPAVDTRPAGVGSRTEASQPGRSTTEQAGEKRNEPGGNDTERPAATTDNSQRVGQRGAEPAQQPEQPAVKRGLGTEKVPYRKQSGNPFTLQSLMPAEQADVVKSALEELGDVDQFLVDELGYSSKEELHQALAAEQIDSVALAIHQMNQGNAFIIGDQTGIGKGRQAAALIRYGVKKGGFPVFITVKKALFSDMYRDLCDIGSPKLRPFIWSADDTEHSGNVTDKNGDVIYQTPNAKEQKRVIDYINKNGKLPPEYDYVLTTYDSFKSGTMDYEEGQKKERKFPKGKKPGPVHFNGQAKRDALETLAQNSYVIMDESHNAGGEGSNVSNYLQYITTKAKGLTFLSATFAKRPGNMPIYSLKTAISKAGVKVGELIDAVKRGGATFQEIMSKALTEAGQMIRRERDMTGVTIDWKGIEDEDIIQKQREQYDTVIGLFNDIIQFQRSYVDPIVNGMNDAAAEEQGEVDHTPGTRDMGINNTPFASRTYNMVQQVLLSLKAKEAAKRAIEHLKLGRKPVITVANTNEGAADEVAGADGESMEMPDLSVNLKKGLQGTMRITKKDAFGNTVNEMIPFDRLSKEGQKRYAEIMDAIENASSGLSLSPIDVIKNELKKAGYKVGELTGRKAEFVYNDDGTVKRVKRQDTDKKKIAADFNNGKLDALILNRSAGTGISLHASSTFKDQRQRIMIVAQAQGDVNDEVQIRGRIDRTGQVLRGMYEYVVSQIPSEQRLLMMLKAKLRSLDANTTSSQKSKFNEMQVQDIINKYGDEIVIQYLSEHVDLAMKMCDPLKWGEGAETLPAETLVSQAQKAQGDGATASKVLGRMALLTVKEQENMLKEIGDLYQSEIDRLNEMGENDLEITEMPLRAKTLKKDVWEAGVEPGGKNPFADNSYVEEVEMDVLRKPMKAEEVKKSQARLLGGKTWDEYKHGVLDKVDKWAEKKKAEATQTITERAEKKAEAEKEKYAKGAKKAQEKNGMTDAEIEKNSQYQYDTFYKQEMEKLQNALEAVDKQKQAFIDALETFSTDGVYALPTDIYDLSQLTFEPSFGKVIDINIKEDNYSTTASTITFATLDGRRKITIPISGMVKQNNGEKRDIKPIIVQQTAQTRNGMFGSNLANMQKVLEQNVDNWDKLTSTATRKKGHIITGNLLKALTSLRSQGKGGKLISYTTDTGEIRQGILMSDQFDPKTLTSKNPISSAKNDLDDFEKDNKIVSADGDVTVKRGRYDWRNDAYGYTLQVPKSKKKGEKYFNDQTLLSLVDGQFEGSTKMSADFPARNLDAILKRLDELGVTVESAKEDSDAPKRMITTYDPIEAINQAAESWRQSNGKTPTNSKLQEISDMVNSLASREDLKGSAPTYTINSPQDLEALKDKVSRRVYREIERLYSDPDNGAAYIPRAGIVVVFGEHLEDAKEAEAAWWHEQTHSFWQKMPEDVRRKFGEACYEWLRVNRPDIFNHITKPGNYERYDWFNESCAFLIGNVVIESYGTEKFLNGNFVGNPEICNFANELRNHIKNGRQESTNAGDNQLRRIGEGEQTSATEVRGSSQQGQGRGDNVIRPEEESELPEDPIQAIEQSAKRWIKFRKEQKEGVKEIDKNSAKAVYHDRINRASTMMQEAAQDDMVTFKHGQNAIAKDKDIPDSQNAYQAMNLSYGRIYIQQEQFTDIYKRPLEATVYEVCRKMGWQTGDVDRYLFTKSGFERNRELFVRDWLKGQRRKNITYDDLDDEQQEAYDKIAERLEEQFEDGDITEEQKNKKLDQALDKLWQEHLDKLENSYVEAKEQAYQDLMEGKKTFPEYLDAIDNFIHDNIDEEFDAEEHDASGFTEMFGEGFKEQDILDELMADEQKMGKELMDKMWSQINLCSQLGLDKYRESGMISDQTYKRITNMFHFYVPMRGYSNDTSSEDHWQYMTVKDGAGKMGGLLKHAKGRKSEAGYPLATLFAMTYKAISDGEQNMVKQKFYRLCQANPNDLVMINDTWAVLDPVSGEWVIDYPKVNSDMSAQEVEARTQEFYERMKQMELEGKAKKVKSDAKFDYKVDKQRMREHVVEVMINGNRKTMVVMGNPRMAQAINGQLRYKHGDGPLDSFVADAKYYMQSVSTSYNVTFLGRNMARDWTHFGAIIMAREGGKYEKAAQGYYFEQLPKMMSLFKKYREGKLDMNNEMERDFKDFMDSGGITGFVHMKKVEELQRDIQKMINTPGKVKQVSSAFWDKTLGALEAANEAIENNARFATYRASRHVAGRTKARSAYDAKEVTVNFNKRGAGKNTAGFKTEQKWVARTAKLAGNVSQILLANKMFFNATVQAICNIFRNIRNSDGSINKSYVGKLVGYYAIPPFALGMLMPVINDLLFSLVGGGGDDDPYANLPEWVRRKNLCIYTGWIPGCGKNDFLVLPMGQELAAFYSLGDMIAGNTFAPNLKPVDKDFMDEMIGFFNVFSPVDFETEVTSNFDPVHEVVGRVCSPLAPLVAVGENLSWTGRQIFRQDKYNGDEYTPEYQMTYGNTNSAYISLSKWLNDVSGGDDVHAGWAQINPGAMQYIFEQYAGGPGKFFMNTGSAIRDAYNVIFTDEEPDFNIRKIEFARAFWQQGDERTEIYRTKAKYHKYQQEANKFAHDFNGYKRDADTNPEHYMKAMEMASTNDAVRMEFVKRADKVLKQINTAANQATGRDRKNLRALYNSQMQLVVEELDKIGQIE